MQGLPATNSSNSNGRAQNKTRLERKLGDGAKFIVPTMYLSVCVYSCFMLPTNTAFLCSCCYCSGCACCNTINFRFCLSRKVASSRAVLTSLHHFTLPLLLFFSYCCCCYCCCCVFIIGRCIFMERKQQLSCQCHCSNMTYT